MPASDAASWFVLSRVRQLALRGELACFSRRTINKFMAALPEEHRLALLVDMVPTWAALGAECAMFDALRKVVGL